MNPLFVDYEVRSQLDIKRVGAHEFLKRAEILMVGVGAGQNKPDIYAYLGYMPDDISPVSWGRFDYLVYRNLGPDIRDPERWVDAQALAAYLGFPLSINAFCTVVGFEAKKDPAGTRLINKYVSRRMTVPSRARGEDLERFQNYCIQDVVLLQKAWKVLGPFYDDWQEQWRENYEMYQRMNERGVPIDRESAIKARKRAQDRQQELREECQKLVGFTPSQTEEVRAFLDLPNIQKGTLEAKEFKDPTKERVRQIRLLTAKSAATKLTPMIDMSASDGRVRGCFISNGAHTGRGPVGTSTFRTSRGRRSMTNTSKQSEEERQIEDPIAGAQENIPRIYPSWRGHGPMRRRLCTDPKHEFSRWLADDKEMLDAFRDPDRDVYCELAGTLYECPANDIAKGSEQRQLGKTRSSGCRLWSLW